MLNEYLIIRHAQPTFNIKEPSNKSTLTTVKPVIKIQVNKSMFFKYTKIKLQKLEYVKIHR